MAEHPAYLNGALVNMADNVVPTAGRIQIQSEGAEIQFRRIELFPLWSPPGDMKKSKLSDDTYTDRQGNAFPCRMLRSGGTFASACGGT